MVGCWCHQHHKAVVEIFFFLFWRTSVEFRTRRDEEGEGKGAGRRGEEGGGGEEERQVCGPKFQKLISQVLQTCHLVLTDEGEGGVLGCCRVHMDNNQNGEKVATWTPMLADTGEEREREEREGEVWAVGEKKK